MASFQIAAPVLASLAGAVALRLWQHRTAAVTWAQRRQDARYHRTLTRTYHRPAHRRTA